VRGALLCSCRLLAPRFSAIDSLQECSSLFEEPKRSAAFAGYAAGRYLHIFPTSFWDCFHSFYHKQQPCYYEGLFFYVEEFSFAGGYWRFAHQSAAKHIDWEDGTLLDSIALGKAKGTAEQKLQYPRGMGNSA
jgi:hypothetical protein